MPIHGGLGIVGMRASDVSVFGGTLAAAVVRAERRRGNGIDENLERRWKRREG